MDIRMRPWGSWTTRVLVTAFVVSTFVLLLAGAIPAAQAQQPPRLPGSAADAYKPALQENQAEGAIGILAAEEPTTPSLDQFNRSDEYPIWQAAPGRPPIRSGAASCSGSGRCRPARLIRTPATHLLPIAPPFR